ncbi:Auxin-responsive protein SAUR32 [Linum grandiflorum]
MKMKKGCIAVQVGLEEEDQAIRRKFVIPISYLYHPLFKSLLDKAYEVFGYHVAGPLRLPCSVDDFLHLRWQIERESDHHHHHHRELHRGRSSSGHHHHNHVLPTAFSFHSC